MTDVVVNESRAMVQYLADGVQTVFTYPFPILAPPDLAVVFDAGPAPTGYTVSGAGDSAGGDVTFAAAPAAGVRVTLYRDMPVQRTTDFLEAGEFRASAINAELDRLAMMLQQVETAAARATEAADTAQAAESAATASAGAAAISENNAASAAASADADAALAAQWAGAPEDSEVEPGLYSARHWAAKAALIDIAAERRRADRAAIRARQAALAPAVHVMPAWALDLELRAGLDGISVARDGPAHVTDAAGALVPAAPDTPRIDHNPASGAMLGVLLEGQRRNALHDSFNPVTQTRSLAAGTYTLSLRGPGSCALSGGPSGTAMQGAPVTFTLAETTAVTFTVGGSPGAIQCEAGASATSPIETPAGDGATRAAETLSLDDTSWLDPRDVSIVVEAHLNDVPAGGALRLLALDDGTDANRHEIYWTGDIDRLLMFSKVGGVAQGTLSALVGSWADGTSHRIGFTLAGGARALHVDGAEAGSDSIASADGTNQLRIGHNVQGAAWQGQVRRVAAYPRALSSAAMSELTA